MSSLSLEDDNSEKFFRKNLVKDIAKDLVNSKMKNGGRVPHGEVNIHIYRAKDICPTITRNMINRAMQVHWTSLMDKDECAVVSNEDNDTNADFSREKGGRPVGVVSCFDMWCYSFY